MNWVINNFWLSTKYKSVITMVIVLMEDLQTKKVQLHSYILISQ